MQVKYFTMMFIGLLCFCTLSAQTAKEDSVKYGWQNELITGLNLSQTQFDNWKQGGENTLAWQFNCQFRFINNQPKIKWANSGKLTYGAIKITGESTRKSIDEIKLESLLTYKLGLIINPYLAFNAMTQFATGYNYRTEPPQKISAFLDPGYIQEGIGMIAEPYPFLITRVGAAFKQTVTSDYPVPYADDPETKEIEDFKSEVGIESSTELNLRFAENLIFNSKLELFSTLEAIKKTDVSWDNLIIAEISKYFNVNFSLKVFYDRDISVKRQLKQGLAMGITYHIL